MANNLLTDTSTRDFIASMLRTHSEEENADFRPGQWEAICDAVENPQGTILIQNPGWGKSFVYFAATKLNRLKKKGLTIVISPSATLMRNQCTEAQKCGLSALALSSQKPVDWDTVIDKVQRDELDILFIQAERLANDALFEKLITSIIEKASLLVVDEVHSISEKSHDFKPAYRRIAKLLPFMYKEVKVLGTTATANDLVVEDIKCALGKEYAVTRGEWTNQNISLDTVQLPSEAAKYAWLVNALKLIQGSGIIYAKTYRESEAIAKWLRINGINAVATSGILPEVEARFRNNEIKALVTPWALSVGFNKPDIAFVIHFEKPSSLSGYFQQIGRAGRKIPKAYGIMLSSDQDAALSPTEWKEPIPTKEDLIGVSAAISEGKALSADEIQRVANLPLGHINATLEYLGTESSPPLVKKNSKWKRTGLTYTFKTRIVNSIKELRKKERQEVEDYFTSPECKLSLLRESVGDQNNESCGKCTSCLGVHLFPIEINEELLKSAEWYLSHNYIDFISRSVIPKESLTQYIFSKTTKIPETLKHETGSILANYGEGAVGKLIKKEREEGGFSDELVKATVEMLHNKGLSIEAKWVTCVPHKDSEMVSNFAKRVAEELNLPFYEVFGRQLDDGTYLEQQNSVFRLRNLDGNFTFKTDVPYGPVILIDDLFDSGWTMFVASALLRQKFMKKRPAESPIGVPKVFPVALGALSAV